jgi:branched-chain amino acid transport system substrate-binding protein
MGRRLAAILAGSLGAALVLSACGGGNNLSEIQGIHADCGGVEYAGTGKPTKLIVSDLPLKGDSAERSRQMNVAIVQELADRGWKAGPGLKLAFQACDDSLSSTTEWDPALCRYNAQQYAADPDVIGVIGTYNSGCAAAEIPILNRAPGGGVPMVSPGNTLVCLTETAANCESGQPGSLYPTGNRNFARVVANDAVEGAGLASFAKSIGVQRPFILVAAHDLTSKSQGASFENAAKELGLRIAGVIHWDPKKQSYMSVMQDVKGSGADSVVLAGLLEQNGVQVIRDKVAALGPNDGAVKLLAFDGFAQQATIDNTGPDARGIYVGLPGKAPGALTGQGAAFVNELREGITDNPIEGFAPYAGEAAEVLLDAFRVGHTRAGTIAQLFKTQVTGGITGSFSITPTGDPSPARISVQQAAETFQPVKTITPPPGLVTAARGG